MEKRIHVVLLKICGLFLLAIALCPAFPAFAENPDKVVDMAEILTEEEEEKLQEQLLDIAETYACDIAVVTVDSYGGKTSTEFTDDYYYENGYGYGSGIDGIILSVSMGDREYYMSTRGKAIDIFTDYGLERMKESFSGYLSDGEYYRAFRKFGELAEQFIVEASENQPYDVNHTYKEKMSLGMKAAIAAISAAVVSALVLAGLLGQLRSVRAKGAAQDYVRDGSFHVTRHRDIFLYRTVSRIKRAEPPSGGGGSSTHSTSGGGRAGGSGGSF